MLVLALWDENEVRHINKDKNILEMMFFNEGNKLQKSKNYENNWHY